MTRQETKQPFVEERIFGITELHRDELRPSVRSYADNLEEQIRKQFQEKGITSFEQMEQIVFDKRFSIAELEKINNLLERLQTVVATGEIPKHEQEIINNDLMENVNILTNKWSEYNISRSSFDPDKNIKYLKRELDSLPYIPYELILNDSDFAQHLLGKIYSLLPKKQKCNSGLLVALIMNKLFKDIPPEMESKIHQRFNLKRHQNVNFLGTELERGKVDIKGNAGDFIGYHMSRGEISVDNAGDNAGCKMNGGKITANILDQFAGQEMTSGEINVIKANFGLGSKMKNGKITAVEGGDNMGFGMENGEIIAEKAGMFVGGKMTGGVIAVKEAKNHSLGYKMKGGTIIAQKALSQVGLEMEDGLIQVEQADDYLGMRMKGGKIIVGEAGYLVGCQMEKGEIYIKESFETIDSDTVGPEKPDIKIYLKGKRVYFNERKTK